MPARVHVGLLVAALLLAGGSAAQSTLPIVLRIDPSTGSLADLSGAGNDGELLRADSKLGEGVDGGVLRLAGANAIVTTEHAMTPPTSVDITIAIRTTTAGGGLLAFESQRDGSSEIADRHVFIDDEGFVHFGVWDGAPRTIRSEAPVTDGAWHLVEVHLTPVNASSSNIALFIDGTQHAASLIDPPQGHGEAGYWRLGRGSLQDWPGAPTNPAFAGEIGEVRVHADGSVTGRESGVDDPPPGGSESASGPEPWELAGAIAAALLVLGIATWVAVRDLDPARQAKDKLLGGAADRWRDRTRTLFAWRAPSWLAAVVALALMTAILAASPRGTTWSRFTAALLVAGLAGLVFQAITILGGAVLARAGGHTPRYHFWTAGSVTLALTGLAFHAPFGYTGYLDKGRDEAGHSPVVVRRRALAALGGIAIAAIAALAFLALSLATDAAFALLGVSLALGAVAASALPFPTLGGRAIWKWNRPAAVVLAIAASVPYVLHHSGLLPDVWIATVGVAGMALFPLAAWSARRTRTHAPA